MTELMEREQYVNSGVHLGMRKKSKEMESFIFQTRPDGLSIIDIEKIDERINVASSFLSRFDDILFVGRKESAAPVLEVLDEATDFHVIAERFMPGTLTNPSFSDYFEPDILVASDPLIDEQAISEAIKKGIPIVAVCDSYTNLDYVDLIIPGNNKGQKSLGTIFYLLARETLKKKGEIDGEGDFEYELSDFTGEEIE
ncbi:MAG: 30S ribosomal protein S2 [Candidatus Aenigmatarchaeota archaeon]